MEYDINSWYIASIVRYHINIVISHSGSKAQDKGDPQK